MEQTGSVRKRVRKSLRSLFQCKPKKKENECRVNQIIFISSSFTIKLRTVIFYQESLICRRRVRAVTLRRRVYRGRDRYTTTLVTSPSQQRQFGIKFCDRQGLPRTSREYIIILGRNQLRGEKSKLKKGGNKGGEERKREV